MDNNIRMYDNDIEECIRAVQQNPNSATAYFSLGTAYSNRGCVNDDKSDYQLALDNFTKAINMDQNFAAAYNNRGFVYYCKSDNSQAITDYDHAINFYQNSISNCLNNPIESHSLSIAYNNRGNAYKDKGDIDKAITDWNMALHNNPNNTDARINIEKTRQ